MNQFCLSVIDICTCSDVFRDALIPDGSSHLVGSSLDGISPLWGSCGTQTGVNRSGWVPPGSSCSAAAARRPRRARQLLRAVGADQVGSRCWPAPRSWRSFSDVGQWVWIWETRRFTACRRCVGGFSVPPGEKKKKKSPLSFGSSQLTSCSKMLFDTPRLVQMERCTARKLLPVHFQRLPW